jgi:hypothetical protein
VSESEKALFYEKLQHDGLGLTGCCRTMFSNRLSYWLGTNGKLKDGYINLQLLKKFVRIYNALTLML